jgi:hypothetical protein
MNAKLTTIMGIRAVVTGFGQIAMQIKNSPRVARVGRAAMRRDSSTTPNIVSARNQLRFEARWLSAFSAWAEAAVSDPKVTVPVRPIEHPAAPMPSMAIVT